MHSALLLVPGPGTLWVLCFFKVECRFWKFTPPLGRRNPERGVRGTTIFGAAGVVRGIGESAIDHSTGKGAP